MKESLDATDWRILAELQEDGRMTNVALSERLGLSAPPTLRRVKALEEAGLIQGYRALIDEKALGYAVTGFAFVGLESQHRPDLDAFIGWMDRSPAVREAHMLSGEIDFVLKCVARDVEAFQSFIDELTSLDNVAHVRTALALKRVKDAAGTPLEGHLPEAEA
ncbi:MAG: Lrp/AsnC family transcriptional regulator [Hyphomicrobiaceae bacterium]|nr:Lrp/AsnC family transcriptional regulator [Hyphomicrobiaceae bacterium]